MTDAARRSDVLIAEDDDNARSLLIDLLTTLGHTVVAEVSTGREAFERAKDVVPDVVLLDVHMPDGSGIEAAELITQAIPGVAVVLFSGDHTLTLTRSRGDGDRGHRVPAEARAAARARLDDSPRRHARQGARRRRATTPSRRGKRSRTGRPSSAPREFSCAAPARRSRRRIASCSARVRTARCRWWRSRARCWRASRIWPESAKEGRE